MGKLANIFQLYTVEQKPRAHLPNVKAFGEWTEGFHNNTYVDRKRVVQRMGRAGEEPNEIGKTSTYVLTQSPAASRQPPFLPVPRTLGRIGNFPSSNSKPLAGVGAHLERMRLRGS